MGEFRLEGQTLEELRRDNLRAKAAKSGAVLKSFDQLELPAPSPYRNYEAYPSYNAAYAAWRRSSVKMGFEEWLWAMEGAEESKYRVQLDEEWRGACAIMRDYVAPREPTERFFILPLDNANVTISEPICVSIGTFNRTVIDCRSVFRAALRCNAASIVIAHNHPSGDNTPSGADIQLTQTAVSSGWLLGIPVRDSIIVADECVSLRHHPLWEDSVDWENPALTRTKRGRR